MKPRGFTLLETLVALTCAALVLAALYGAVLRTTVAQARATARAERTAAARGALLALASEIEAAFPLAHGEAPFVVTPPAGGDPQSQTLRFVSAARGPAVAADDLPTLSYRVAPDEAGGRGTLLRAETPRLAPPGAAVTEPLPLVDGVRQLRIRCFDGRTWTPVWDGAALPRAVEVTLAVDDGAGGIDDVATTVTIPAAGGT